MVSFFCCKRAAAFATSIETIFEDIFHRVLSDPYSDVYALRSVRSELLACCRMFPFFKAILRQNLLVALGLGSLDAPQWVPFAYHR